MEKIIINAEDAILGRLASYAAKEALHGKEILILNCEKAVITGNKPDIIKKYKILRSLGGRAQKGPFLQKNPAMLLKKSIKGMLPTHREGVGRDAFKKIKCYDKIPLEFEKEKMIKIKTKEPQKFISLEELSKRI